MIYIFSLSSVTKLATIQAFRGKSEPPTHPPSHQKLKKKLSKFLSFMHLLWEHQGPHVRPYVYFSTPKMTVICGTTFSGGCRGNVHTHLILTASQYALTS